MFSSPSSILILLSRFIPLYRCFFLSVLFYSWFCRLSPSLSLSFSLPLSLSLSLPPFLLLSAFLPLSFSLFLSASLVAVTSPIRKGELSPNVRRSPWSSSPPHIRERQVPREGEARSVKRADWQDSGQASARAEARELLVRRYSRSEPV